MSRSLRNWIVPLCVLAVSLACAGSAIPTASPDSLATIVAATMAVITPPATSTALPTVPLPTTTQIPTLPPIGSTGVPLNAVRINFLAGATFGVVSVPIQPGQVQYYVLNAAQGQPMIVNVDSLNHDVTFSLKTQGGTTMLSPASHATSWSGMLPQTEDYYISVYGGATTENFTLSIQIPFRIKFAEGSITATVSGKTVGGYNVAYTILALKGQTMQVELADLSGDSALTIYGYTDGQPYLRSVTEQTKFTFKLPSTQDYIIEVVPRAGAVVSYSLKVIIQ